MDGDGAARLHIVRISSGNGSGRPVSGKTVTVQGNSSVSIVRLSLIIDRVTMPGRCIGLRDRLLD
jgi:hypothetical protein